MINPMDRIRHIIESLNKEIETIKLENVLEDELKVRLEQSQKDFILKEKLKFVTFLGRIFVRRRGSMELYEILVLC